MVFDSFGGECQRFFTTLLIVFPYNEIDYETDIYVPTYSFEKDFIALRSQFPDYFIFIPKEKKNAFRMKLFQTIDYFSFHVFEDQFDSDVWLLGGRRFDHTR